MWELFRRWLLDFQLATERWHYKLIGLWHLTMIAHVLLGGGFLFMTIGALFSSKSPGITGWCFISSITELALAFALFRAPHYIRAVNECPPHPSQPPRTPESADSSA